jgi:class 3 adenylate cyclase
VDCDALLPPAGPQLGVTEGVGMLMKRYIPQAILPQLEARHDAHLAELREVSVLFVNIHGIDLSDPHTDLEKLINQAQMLMLEIQRTVYHWEGSINKMFVDDKGLLVLCALGLPPMHHSDDPDRAVSAALALVDNIRHLGPNVHASVGVTSGRCFCGVIGSETRREYMIMGDIVNSACRLMAKAGLDGVLVGSETYERTKDNPMFVFSEPRELALKGKKKLVVCYSLSLK